MVNRAALHEDSSRQADPGISAEHLNAWRDRFLGWQGDDPDRVLASFTIVADLTVLPRECSFAGDSRMLVARYDGLPFAAVAFSNANLEGNGEDARRLARLTHRLIPSKETFICLVAERQWRLLQDAYDVLRVREEWQMVFPVDGGTQVETSAVPLESSSLAQMRDLARREGMRAFELSPLAKGPWYGIWRDGHLVAQGGTHLSLERFAEIGNIVTAPGYRRQGYASQVVSSLTREHRRHGRRVFIQVLKQNRNAVAFYKHMGFETVRTMFLTQCRLARSSRSTAGL